MERRVPLRRYAEDWMTLMGTTGDFDAEGDVFTIGSGNTIEPRRTGPLVLFVNDAVAYHDPRGPWALYRNNSGTTKIRVVHESRTAR